MWKNGDRVLANRPPDPHLYPGAVYPKDAGTLHVFFDDGEEAQLPVAQLRPPRIDAGTPVQVRLPGTRDYHPAVATRLEGDRLSVELADGTQEWTSLGMVRIDPSTPRAGARRAGHGWIVGDRVVSQWT